MPSLSRRGFLQVVGFTSLAPFLPSMPVRTAAASGGMSASKALWAGLYANAGSTTEFVGLAKNMGLSNKAIQGVSARSIGVRVALATSTEKLASSTTKSMHQGVGSQSRWVKTRSKVKRVLEHCFSDETKETKKTAKKATEEQVLETPLEDSEKEDLKPDLEVIDLVDDVHSTTPNSVSKEP